MSSLKGSGWKGSIGGTNYKSKGGKVAITGTEKGKGTVSGLPSAGGKKIGQSFYEGCGGDRGIPKGKPGKYSSQQAAAHDDVPE